MRLKTYNGYELVRQITDDSANIIAGCIYGKRWFDRSICERPFFRPSSDYVVLRFAHVFGEYWTLKMSKTTSENVEMDSNLVVSFFLTDSHSVASTFYCIKRRVENVTSSGCFFFFFSFFCTQGRRSGK